MRPRSRTAVLAALAAHLALAVAAARSAPYVFTNIADDQGEPFARWDTASPVINDRGVVAFRAPLDAGGAGVFLRGNTPPATVAETGGLISGFGNIALTINEDNTVAFGGALLAGGLAFFTGNGGDQPIPFGGPDDGFSNIGYRPSINDSGAVVFRAARDGQMGIHRFSGGSYATLYTASPTFTGIGGGPAVNNAGTVAFRALLPGGGQAVVAGNGGPLTTIADTSGSLSALAHTVAINNAGTVAFVGDLDDGGQAVVVGNGGTLATIADTRGPFQRFVNDNISVAINDAGAVAFAAGLDDGGAFGIFTGPDARSDKVITTGDPLFGATVSDLGQRFGMNNRGQIALRYDLADGRTGVAVATPALNGDANLDGSVNGSDFALLAGNFGRTGRSWGEGDFNEDGSVNGTDFALLAGNFGRSLEGAAAGLLPADEAALAAFAHTHGITVVTPEPGAPGAAAVAAGLLLARRRRRTPCGRGAG